VPPPSTNCRALAKAFHLARARNCIRALTAAGIRVVFGTLMRESIRTRVAALSSWAAGDAMVVAMRLAVTAGFR